MQVFDANFDVHSSVLFKLGEDLITDVYQALAELIKNSYDADASYAKISIDTRKRYVITNNQIQKGHNDCGELLGSIMIEDDGSGMDVSDIVHGWLTVSASQKGLMKSKGKTTPLHMRTPLGDKGLGRLGAQRLGRVIRLETKKSTNVGLSVQIDWDRFRDNQSLSDIDIKIEEDPNIKKQGTLITIVGLYDQNAWLNLRELQKSFLKIISPYSDSLGFNVKCRVNNENIDLRAISKDVISSSIITYKYEFNGSELHCDGFFSLRYLDDLRKRKNREYWREFIESNHGKDFFQWLYDNNFKKAEHYHLQYEDSSKPFRVSFDIPFDSIAGLHKDKNNQPISPGPFTARLDFVNLPYLKEKGGALREFMDSIKGVQVYRDGFGIRLKDNIVPFSEQWTSGGSFYTLRPDNVIGYINISAKGNPLLKETTSREEFVKDSVYANFEALLSSWLKCTEEVQGFLRRSYKKYQTECIAQISENVVTADPEELAGKAKNSVQMLIDYGIDQPLEGKVDKEQLLQVHNASIDLLVQNANDEILSNQSSWELISLGIIAESISHEIGNISQRMISEASYIDSLNNDKYKDIEISMRTEAIHALASSLLKQIAHLDSSLRYTRERRQSILISKFIKEWSAFLQYFLGKDNIELSIKIEDDFEIYANEGRMTQVLDNLALNSIYWLNSDLNCPDSTKAISIIIHKPIILFYDSGPGISKSVEFTLFDPFVSRKKESPRGLGLYVVRNLLENIGASIELISDRNIHGNRYIFVIDLKNLIQE